MSEFGMPADVETLQKAVRHAVAQLMAHTQTVQELIKANMDLRAALHLLNSDKSQLEEAMALLMNPEESNKDADTISA
jgi:hypothetical protein